MNIIVKRLFKLVLLSLIVGQYALADKVKLLAKDSDALQARVDLIQQAKNEILVEYFSVWNDEQSVGGFALLLEAAQRGVKVKVIMDALANTVPRSMISALMLHGKGPDGAQNFELKVYNPVSLNLFKAFHRDHSKMLIVDNKIIISGGRNVGDKYFGFSNKRNFKDLDVIVSGDVVQKAHQNYMTLWKSEITAEPLLYENAPEMLAEAACATQPDAYEQCESSRRRALKEYDHEISRIQGLMKKLASFAGDKLGLATNTGTNWNEKMSEVESVQFLSHEIALVDKSNNTMTKELGEIAMKAKHELRIMTPYLILTDTAFKIFQDLIDQGVKIRIVTNSLRSTDNLFAQAGYRVDKEKLAGLGLEIYEFNGPDTFHAKAAVVDGEVALVGTYNLDPLSANTNREVGFAFKGNQEILDDLNAQFDDALKNSTLVAKNKARLNEESEFKDVTAGKVKLLKALMFIAPFIKHRL